MPAGVTYSARNRRKTVKSVMIVGRTGKRKINVLKGSLVASQPLKLSIEKFSILARRLVKFLEPSSRREFSALLLYFGKRMPTVSFDFG